MPAYLAPGVYIEENEPARQRSRASRPRPPASSARAARGRWPVCRRCWTSLGDFERLYGDGQPLALAADGTAAARPNFLWHAARSFFDNAGGACM